VPAGALTLAHVGHLWRTLLPARTRKLTFGKTRKLTFGKPVRVNGLTRVDRLRVGRGAARAEDAQGTPTQSHVSPSIVVNEDT